MSLHSPFEENYLVSYVKGEILEVKSVLRH